MQAFNLKANQGLNNNNDFFKKPLYILIIFRNTGWHSCIFMLKLHINLFQNSAWGSLFIAFHFLIYGSKYCQKRTKKQNNLLQNELSFSCLSQFRETTTKYLLDFPQPHSLFLSHSPTLPPFLPSSLIQATGIITICPCPVWIGL